MVILCGAKSRTKVKLSWVTKILCIYQMKMKVTEKIDYSETEIEENTVPEAGK